MSNVIIIAEKEVKKHLEALCKIAIPMSIVIPRAYVHCEVMGESVRLTASNEGMILSVTTLKEYLYRYIKDYFGYELPGNERHFAFLPTLGYLSRDFPFFLPDDQNIINWKSSIPLEFNNPRLEKPFFHQDTLDYAGKVWRKATGRCLGAPDLWVDDRSLCFWVHEGNFIAISPLYLEDVEVIYDCEQTLTGLCGNSIFESDIPYKEIEDPEEPQD